MDAMEPIYPSTSTKLLKTEATQGAKKIANQLVNSEV